MTQKRSHWPWFGLGALAGLMGGWLLARRTQEVRMPHLDVWRRELTRTRGAVQTALLAGRIQARYDVLRAQGPRFSQRVLDRHVRTGILPGLALYQTLCQEYENQTAALAETERLFAAAYKGQAAILPLLKRLPDPFAVFRRACKWMLRLSFPATGWDMTFSEDTTDCIAFEVRDRCLYRDVLTALGAPELTAAFCKTDDLVYTQLAPEIVYTRTKTLGRGDECCNFRYCRGGVTADETSKVDVRQLNTISETLLLPLAYRATESRRSDALIHDPRAAEILAQLNYDSTKLERQSFQQLNVALRVREFDRAVRAFLEAHPDGVVVDIGCGLDTRLERICSELADNERLTWFNLDLPEVITLRERFFAPHPRCRTLACSALDFAWMDEVAQAPGPYFFLAEGVFAYLAEDEIRRLALALRDRFPGAQLMFDALPALMTRLSRLHPALRQTRAARVRWGLGSSYVLETWGAGRLLSDWRYYDRDEPRLGWYKIFRHIPFLRDFRILRYQLAADHSS